MPGDEALEREFDVLMERSGIVVPPELRDGALAGYRELRAVTALLRQPRDADSEPSNVYSLDVILRST